MRVADLGLRQILREAQPQDLALALGQDPHQPLDRGRVLGLAEARVLDAERDADAVALLVVVARAVERRPRGRRRPPRAPRAPARASRRGAGRSRAGVGGAPELARRAPSLTGSSLTASSCRSRGTRTDQPLSRKWRLSSPRIVGTAKLENAVSRRRVEAVDRLQQPERGDLDQVVERLAAALVAAGELAGERQEALDELLARELVAGVRALEQRAVGARARRPGLRLGGICSRRAAPTARVVRDAPRPGLVRQEEVAPGCWGANRPSGGGLGRGTRKCRRRLRI